MGNLFKNSLSIGNSGQSKDLLNTPITKNSLLSGFSDYVASSDYTPGGDSDSGKKGGGFLKNLDPAMKMDLGLAGLDILGSIAMGAQSAFAKPPKTYRVAAPTLEAPKLTDNTATEEALIKENLGMQTNTVLNYLNETGQDVRFMTGVFAEGNRAMRESAAKLTKEKRDISNQQSMINAETANQNKMLAYQEETDYAKRKEEATAKDSLMRGQQLSMAVSNIGQVGSRLINDYMLTNLIKEGNKSDSIFAMSQMFSRK